MLYSPGNDGISNLETWVNVRSLLQTTVHNCLEVEDECSVVTVGVYSK